MFLRCFKGLRQYYYEVVLSATVVIDEEDYDPNVTVTDFSATRYVTASTLNVRDSWRLRQHQGRNALLRREGLGHRQVLQRLGAHPV